MRNGFSADKNERATRHRPVTIGPYATLECRGVEPRTGALHLAWTAVAASAGVARALVRRFRDLTCNETVPAAQCSSPTRCTA
jgi:hypothetical protein